MIDFEKAVKLKKMPKVEVTEIRLNDDNKPVGAVIRVYLYQDKSGEWMNYEDFRLCLGEFDCLENTEGKAPTFTKYLIPNGEEFEPPYWD